MKKTLAKKKPERFQTAREALARSQTYLLRRGVFVGPEEVAAVVRDLFGDRIKSREDHLAWAADVTSTKSTSDQLKARQVGQRSARRGVEERSLEEGVRAFSDDGAPIAGRKQALAQASRPP